MLNVKFDSSAVATGCSLGVDSLSTILKYTADDCPSGYKLTHLTFFNAGAYGSKNLEKAREVYENDLILVKKFAREIGLGVVELETNSSLLYKDFPRYGDSGFLRNMSCILSMQKLFKRYLYASTYQVTDLSHSLGSFFYLLASMFSTPSTSITITLPTETRTDKTEMMVGNTLTQKHLNVCWGHCISMKEIQKPNRSDNIFKIVQDAINAFVL